jgi:ACS family hexuronate transporter-like MFS transporter
MEIPLSCSTQKHAGAFKILGLRWYIAALIFLATVINYVDRQTFSVAAPTIKQELHLTQIQYGYILQAFMLAYTVMYFFSGFLVDRWGTRKSLSIFISWWSSATMLNALGRGVRSFACINALSGMGEPGNFNAAGRATSEWFPPKERAFINGLVNAGGATGAVISIPLVAWAATHYGWRMAFVFAGTLGFLWLIPWMFLYKLPKEHPAITEDELAYIQSGPAALRQEHAEEGAATLVQLLHKPDIWGLIVTRFFSDPVWWFFIFWLPSYLLEQRGLTLAEIAFFGWMPYLASGAGSLFGGWASGWIIRKRGGNPVRARLLLVAICAFIMPVCILVPFTHSISIMIAILCAVAFFYMASKTNLMTITNDVYPTHCVGTVSGIFMFGSGLGGFLFQGITATIVQYFSYTAVFAVVGLMPVIALIVCYWGLNKAKLLRPIL